MIGRLGHFSRLWEQGKAPIAGINLVGTYSPNATIGFQDSSTNNPTSWQWDFGDGNTSTSQNPTHSYTGTEPQVVTVGLTASNEYGSDYTEFRFEIPPIVNVVSHMKYEWVVDNLYVSGISGISTWRDSGFLGLREDVTKLNGTYTIVDLNGRNVIKSFKDDNTFEKTTTLGEDTSFKNDFMITFVVKYDPESGSLNQSLSPFKIQSSNGDFFNIYSFSSGTGDSNQVRSITVRGDNSFEFSTQVQGTSPEFIDGNFYIITVGYNGTDMKIYVDNTEYASSDTISHWDYPIFTGETLMLLSHQYGLFDPPQFHETAYVGIDNFDLSRLEITVSNLKTYYGI